MHFKNLDQELHTTRSKTLSSINWYMNEIRFSQQQLSKEDLATLPTPKTKQEEEEYIKNTRPVEITIAYSAKNLVEHIHTVQQKIHQKRIEHQKTPVMSNDLQAITVLPGMAGYQQKTQEAGDIVEDIALLSVPLVMFTKSLDENNLRQVNASLYDTHNQKTGKNSLSRKQLAKRLQSDSPEIYEAIFNDSLTNAYEALRPVRNSFAHTDITSAIDVHFASSPSLKEDGNCLFEHLKPIVQTYMQSTRNLYSSLAKQVPDIKK